MESLNIKKAHKVDFFEQYHENFIMIRRGAVPTY